MKKHTTLIVLLSVLVSPFATTACSSVKSRLKAQTKQLSQEQKNALNETTDTTVASVTSETEQPSVASKNEPVDLEQWAATYENMEQLSQLCSGDVSADMVNNMRQRNTVCEAYVARRYPQVSGATCESWHDVTQKHVADADAHSDKTAIIKVGVNKGMQCAQWDLIASIMNSEVKRNIPKIVLRHVNVLDEELLDPLLGALASDQHPVKSFDKIWHPSFAETLSAYYNDRPDIADCDDIKRVMDDLSGDSKVYLLGALSVRKCGQGVGAAEDLLESSSHETRRSACIYLGDYGTQDSLPKLSPLALEDSYNVYQSGSVIYPVRDACTNAYNKLSM